MLRVHELEQSGVFKVLEADFFRLPLLEVLQALA